MLFPPSCREYVREHYREVRPGVYESDGPAPSDEQQLAQSRRWRAHQRRELGNSLWLFARLLRLAVRTELRYQRLFAIALVRRGFPARASRSEQE
jgi:hypothetical protein